jgi:hypothetical protein
MGSHAVIAAAVAIGAAIMTMVKRVVKRARPVGAAGTAAAIQIPVL